MAYQVGDKAKIADFAGATLADGGVTLPGSAEYQFLGKPGTLSRTLHLVIFAERLSDGAEALGIDEVDGDVVVFRIPPREEDAEGWVINSAGLADGQEISLAEIEFTRVF